MNKLQLCYMVWGIVMKPNRSIFWSALHLLLLLPLIIICTTGCNRVFWSEYYPDSGETAPPGGFVLPEPPALASSTAPETRLGVLFYPDAEKRFLVPVCLPIPSQEGIARATLEYLVPSSGMAGLLQKNGLSYIFPPEVDICGLSISETGLARVDFSAAFLQYPPVEERLVLGSLLCTLRQFPSIEEVEVMVEGATLEKFPGGTSGLVPLGPQCWVNLEVDPAVEDYRHFSAVKLYFCYSAPSGNIFYVPVTRILVPEEDLPWATVRELLQGPSAGSGLFTEIPPETCLLGVKVEDGRAVANFSREIFLYQGGRTGAENVAYQLRLTLGTLEGVEEVEIFVEGQPAVFKEGPDLGQPLPPPYPYNLLP